MLEKTLPPEQHFFSPAEVAALLNVSARTVTRWISYGYLTAFRLDSTTRIPREALLAFLESWQTAPPAEESAPPSAARLLEQLAQAIPLQLPVPRLQEQHLAPAELAEDETSYAGVVLFCEGWEEAHLDLAWFEDLAAFTAYIHLLRLDLEQALAAAAAYFAAREAGA